MPVTVSAPGKLVLLGEYAVLFGAPAAVMAVNRRARVVLSPAAAALWSVEAPGLLAHATEFQLGADGSVRWHGREQRLPLLEGLLAAGVASGLLDGGGLAPAALRLDTTEFFANRPDGSHTKIGIGSSAALTVALGSALASWNGRGSLVADRRGWLTELLGLHRAIQGGHGSGIDLAAALYGGVLSFRIGDGGRNATARPLELPSGLELVFVWTGRSADTGSFLRRLAERMEHQGGAIRRILERLGSASAAGITAMRSLHRRST